MDRVKELVKKLSAAKDAYYNTDNSIMTDFQYDMLEDELRKLSPDNEFFKIVGSKLINGRKKVKHTHPMLSCAKAKNMEEFGKWVVKVNACGRELIVEPKIDGSSGSIAYVNGKIYQAATRGDGKEGLDITKLMEHINIPKSISLMDNIEIRGEFVLPKDAEVENEDDKNLRNICSGYLNRKTIIPSDLSKIHFIAYQILGSHFERESSKIDFLKENGFETIEYHLINHTSELEPYYNKYLSKLRDKWSYFTDGLVIVVNNSTLHAEIDRHCGNTDHHHNFNVAVKPPNISKITKLISIEWNVKRSGRLIPTAIFEPVEIDGSTITRASLSNYDTVIRLGLQKGHEIEVEKAGMIIPYVKQNITTGISQR